MKSTEFQNVQTKYEKSNLRQKHFFELQIKNLILSILVISTLFLQNTFAQDYTRWDLPEGARLRIGKGHVGQLCFSPDSKRLIVDNEIGLWSYDAHTGAELDFIAENRGYNFRLGPEMGLSWDTKMYVTLNAENTINVRNLIDSSVKISLTARTEDIYCVAFSPDGNTLAVAIKDEIHLWDLATGVKKAPFLGHSESVTTIAFSPDGTMLASVGSDKRLKVWNVATARPKKNLSDYASGIRYLIFSPDGKTLYTAGSGHSIRAWNIATGFANYAIYPDSVYCIALSPDGKTLAGGGFQGLHLWDAATGTYKAELGGHVQGIRSIAFSPDGTKIASGNLDELFIWDAESGERKMAIPGHTSHLYEIAFSPDNRTLVTGSYDKIKFWDTSTGEHKTTFYPGRSVNKSMDFNPDGTVLASTMWSGISLWDVNTGAPITVLRGSGGGNRDRGSAYNSIAYSPDGSLLAGANPDTTIQLWYEGRARKGALLGHTDSVNSIDFNSNGRVLVSGSTDKTVRLWDVAGGTYIAIFKGHSDAVNCVAFSPDARLVASGSKDNTIIIWDVLTGKIKFRLTGHIDEVLSVAFSPDGKTLASSGGTWEDSTVRLWDVATGKEIATLTEHSFIVSNVKFSPDGKTLASVSGDGTVLLWDYAYFRDGEKETEHLAEDVNRDGVVDLQDLVFVASQFGESGTDNAADVNGDDVINIADILLVAAALENVNSAPSRYSQSEELLTATAVQQWLTQARQINTKTPTFQRGVAVLEQLLEVLTPKKTTLLHNYPNPFNPETWIPYQLGEDADVTIRIHSSDGQLVRTLVLGNQPAGVYQSQSRAAYWDGKNELGEPVASGIYFYTLSAATYKATRRMVIRK